MGIGESLQFKDLTIYGVSTQHTTARYAVGYIIEGSWTIYFPGDTALSEIKMREMGNNFEIDLALLPIGCYRGSIFSLIPISYRSIHMAPEQLVKADEYLHPKVIVPIHWGTFILGTEPIREVMDHLQTLIKKVKLPVKILLHGKWISWNQLKI